MYAELNNHIYMY